MAAENTQGQATDRPATSGKPVRRGAGRPSAEEAERKGAATLEAALEEFASRGFRGASLRAIAARADISTRTLYNRYPDKTTLFAACLEASQAQFHQIVAADPPTPAPAPTQQAAPDLAAELLAHVTGMTRLLAQERSKRIAALLYREGIEFADVREIARLHFERYQVDPVVEILRRHGQHGPALRDEATHFVAMAFGPWQRDLLFGGPPLTEEAIARQAAQAVRIFLTGIGVSRDG